MSIASATKWLFGAYIAERNAGTLSTEVIKHLTMAAGYSTFTNGSCNPIGINTVLKCFEEGTNDTYTAAHDDKFYYASSNFQHLGVLDGIGALTRTTLATDIEATLAIDDGITFPIALLAGGIQTNAAVYASFLQRTVSNQLHIYNLLGSSPIPDEWHYSLGHWVEDDPATGDGAFSSPGLFGFYPWIDASKTYYGILARMAVQTVEDAEAEQGTDGSAYWQSVKCGRLIRKAYITGTAQN